MQGMVISFYFETLDDAINRPSLWEILFGRFCTSFLYISEAARIDIDTLFKNQNKYKFHRILVPYSFSKLHDC